MNPFIFDIWLHVGREGRCFSYQDGNNLDIDLGDVVRVRLKGQLMQGLVVKKMKKSITCAKENLNNISFNNIETLVQKEAVKKEWRDWLKEIAHELFVSDFQMLKTALPSGWLGRSKISNGTKKLWWVKLSSNKHVGKISNRQIQLKKNLLLNGGGKWQKDLEADGFSSVLIRNFVSSGCGEREKRSTLFKLNSHEVSIENNCLKVEDPRFLKLYSQSILYRYLI